MEELERHGASAEKEKTPNVRVRRGVTIVDVTEECSGQLFGIVGATSVKPPGKSNVRPFRIVKKPERDESLGDDGDTGKPEGER